MRAGQFLPFGFCRNTSTRSPYPISRRRRLLRLGLAVGWVLLLAPAVRAGILSLAWDAPTTNADGAPLTDLSGYRVYSGVATLGTCPPASTPQFVASATPAPAPGTVVTYQLTGLTDGTIYFLRVTAVNTSGNESTCSNEVSGAALPDPSPSSDSGGAGCFIATAAYGSPLAQEVQVLREFRNRVLLTHAPGRFLVAVYYRLSPPLAARIRQSPVLQVVTRALLWPVIWGAQGVLAAPALVLILGGGIVVAGPLLLVARHPAQRRKP